MEIIKHDGKVSLIKFVDKNNISCEMWVELGALRFEIGRDIEFDSEDLGHFSQEDIKALLPYLQSFAETGQLEPSADTPLQGGSLAEAFKPEQNVKLYEQSQLIDRLTKEKAYCLSQLDKQVDKIAELEEVVEKWRNIVERGGNGEDLNELQEKTIQLLGEEVP